MTIDQRRRRYRRLPDAKCTGTLFRGFETILNGRDPWDAADPDRAHLRRLPGLARHGRHQGAGQRGRRRAFPPTRDYCATSCWARTIIQSHILHFYLLAALDYTAGPATRPGPRLDRRSAARFGGDRRTPFQAIEARRRAHEMGAIFGGRMPLPPAPSRRVYHGADSARASRSSERTSSGCTDLHRHRSIIPDVAALGGIFPEYFDLGKGCGNLLAYGVFDLADVGSATLLKRGQVAASSPDVVQRVEHGPHQRIGPLLVVLRRDRQPESLGRRNGAALPQSGCVLLAQGAAVQRPPVRVRPAGAHVGQRGLPARRFGDGPPRGARAGGAKVAGAMAEWLDQLAPGEPVHTGKPHQVNGTASGSPRLRAGRSATGCGSRMADRSYQVITPTCWNASPRDTGACPDRWSRH